MSSYSEGVPGVLAILQANVGELLVPCAPHFPLVSVVLGGQGIPSSLPIFEPLALLKVVLLRHRSYQSAD